jgi:hypothetical protein
VQVINWILALVDGNSAGVPGQGFKQAGFESFERLWTGQQVRVASTVLCTERGSLHSRQPVQHEHVSGGQKHHSQRTNAISVEPAGCGAPASPASLQPAT